MILLCILILLALCGSAHGTCGGICGLRPMHATFGSSRVVGGTDVLPGSGAWAGIASIRCFWKPPISVHVCGGTLIDAQWLLTAAHCFTNITNPISEWAVVLGATSLGQSGHEVEVRRIKRLIIHELYVPKLEYNDIALLELDRPVLCSSSIQLACLPGPTVKVSELKNCYVAGWGDRIVKSSGRDILQQAKVQVVNNKLCNSSDWLQGYIYDFHVCAGQGGVGTCQGDSGGPLVCQSKHGDFFWQIGVTSWGVGCARPKRPAVSSSTQYYYSWIQAMMRKKPAVTPVPAYTTPLQTLPPKPMQPCPFSREKLLNFFNLLKEILKFLKEKMF
ncbi:acrosin-like [Corvus hawaiiensis]|uniref:acrosin-like n=1 Tax=Corvus hawaiiensis TaxID=134902 RepID=UPI002019CBB5|nr:acrosin-like [Corvus hawaiiensis]